MQQDNSNIVEPEEEEKHQKMNDIDVKSENTAIVKSEKKNGITYWKHKCVLDEVRDKLSSLWESKYKYDELTDDFLQQMTVEDL